MYSSKLVCLTCSWLLGLSLHTYEVAGQAIQAGDRAPHKRAHPLFVRHRNLAPPLGPSAWNRGFVICASGPGREAAVPDAIRTVAAVKSLRRTGNHDLVMIFHVDSELPDRERRLLKEYKGVMVRDLKDVWDGHDLEAVNNNTNMFRSFDCKIMALLHSPFKKTILIDSDTIFFQNPARVFDNKVVKDTGTLFFYDRLVTDGNPNLIKGDKKCNNIADFAHWADDLKTTMLVDFKRAHMAYCQDLTAHEQDASMVAVDSTHPAAAKFLSMLKNFHTKHLLKNATVQQWGFGDKEYYWIACEFAGIHCGFSPRGRPMHLFFDESFENGGGRLMRSQGDTGRPGCSAQVALDGDGSDLLYVNLSDKYCPWDSKLNAITVWNPSETGPVSRMSEGRFEVRTGRGARPLRPAEQAVADAYRDDVARMHNI